jgi:nucleoside-diphosphate-sugar epimerase
MTTYAILGATGQTGSEIVKALLPTSAHLNIYARSQARLEAQFPHISTAPNVTLFIGDLSDTSLLTSCISNADVILSTVAQNRNEPGCSIAQRTALAIIDALEPRRLLGDRIPNLVFLSSGSLDPGNLNQETLGHKAMYWVLHHIYDDLKAAIKLLHANPWVPLVIASASGLVHDSKDYPVELTEDLTRVAPLQSYASLAKGMIAMGDEAGRWTGKYVAMRVNDGKPIGGNPLALLRYLLPNLLASLCPPLWVLGKDWWPA